MAEKRIVFSSKVINYEGLFSAREVYMIVDSLSNQKGYDKVELLNSEQVHAKGKDLVILLEPYKKVTDYAKNLMWIRMIMENVENVDIEKDGKTVKMNKGKVTIIIQGFLHTDYEQRWEQKPWWVFIRTIFDKFIYKIYTDRFDAALSADCMDVHNQLKAYLNLQRY